MRNIRLAVNCGSIYQRTEYTVIRHHMLLPSFTYLKATIIKLDAINN